jgi:serine/threonine protein phosphatase PrpC
VWPDSNFCEACSAPANSSAAPASAPAAPSAPATAAASASDDGIRPDQPGVAVCRSCGSGPIDADGYCEACGAKAPSGRDHDERDLLLLAGVTDRGLRHFRNEDAMALAAASAGDSPVAIAVVCDGVSSSGRPDEASQAAAKAALDVLVAAAKGGQDMAEASARAAQAAQQAVIVLAGPPGSTPPSDAPSATFASAVVTPAGVTLCWLGDSRAYWLDSTAPAQLTTDDSVAAALVSAGIMSEEEALASPNAHVVTGWLGADDSGTTPHVCTFVPPGPGVVLICSDGLWNYQPDAAGLAERALPAALTSPLVTARALAQFANDSGGHDNVTVVLVPFPLSGQLPVGPHDVTRQLNPRT